MADEYISNINIYELDVVLQGHASSFNCGNSHIDSFLKEP